MGNILVIAAGGNQERWGLPSPKQLLKVKSPQGEENLLARQIRQFSEWFDDFIILAHHPEIVKRFPRDCWMPGDNAWLSASLAGTHQMWGDNNIILLGDVVYSNKAAQDIMNMADRTTFPVFMGSWLELFALVFDAGSSTEVLLSMVAATNNAYQGIGRGKLWQVYNVYNGIPLNVHRVEDNLTWENVPDWTTDFDSPGEYYEFLGKVKSGEIEVD